MSTKHTPGPWTVIAEAIVSRNSNLGYIHGLHNPRTREAAMANADLMAAAPDMLEALEKLYNECKTILQPELRIVLKDELIEAYNAIKKAKGGQV